MKYLLPLFFLASCGPSRNIQTRCPKDVGIVIPIQFKTTYQGGLPIGTTGSIVYQQMGYSDTSRVLRLLPPTRDTVPEWMHVSMRDVGFVVARKALSVRVDGYCTAHLDCSGKPFPEHYRVGWCEGKELLFNRLVKGRVR